MKSWLRMAAASACLAAASNAQAQTYPSKPITIIVPASPGGVTDMLARILAQHFNADWGAQTVVENKPGANNQVAAEYVMHQPGDGYTLFIGPETTFIVNPTLYPDLRYKLADFTPISGLVQINHGLILHPSVPANSVKELVALAKAKPGQLNYGTYGAGSSGHLNMEMFKTVTGTDLVAVHYKGAAPAMQDVIAGHIQLMFVSVGNAVPQSKSGAVKFIASAHRSAWRCCRTCRPSPRQAIPASRRCRGSRCSGRPAFRPTWSPRSTARCARFSPIRPFRRRFSTRNISNLLPVRRRN